jgi:Mn-containing catalase
MLSFLIARGTMHQNQWMAAIEELEMNQKAIVPSTFPQDLEKRDVSYAFIIVPKGKKARKDVGQVGRVWMDKENLSIL